MFSSGPDTSLIYTLRTTDVEHFGDRFLSTEPLDFGWRESKDYVHFTTSLTVIFPQ